MVANDDIVQSYIAGLARARDSFLALREELLTAHPDWQDGKDARLNVLVKTVNLIVSAIVNLRLTQYYAVNPLFWSTAIAPHLNTPELIAPQLFELQTFYRFGFFQFLTSAVEHGLRAIQPLVVDGVDSQSDQAYWKIYTSVFRKSLKPDAAARHINLLAFLSALRNTIHNNGFYYPLKHENADFRVGDKRYIMRDGERVDFLSWENMIDWLPLIRDALSDLLHAPSVAQQRYISDLASFPFPDAEVRSLPA